MPIFDIYMYIFISYVDNLISDKTKGLYKANFEYSVNVL